MSSKLSALTPLLAPPSSTDWLYVVDGIGGTPSSNPSTIGAVLGLLGDGTLAHTAPKLGTPSSGVATNLTGTAAGLTSGNVTTNANLTGHITSTGNAAILGSFTKTQLSTAVSDGTPLYVGDAPTAHNHAWADLTSGVPTTIGGYGITDFNSLGDARWPLIAHTHLLAAGATDVTATPAELNLLDLAALTAGWVLSADTAATASWKAPAAGGDVTKVGTPVNQEIAHWTGDGTLGRSAGFLWSGTLLTLPTNTFVGNATVKLQFSTTTVSVSGVLQSTTGSNLGHTAARWATTFTNSLEITNNLLIGSDVQLRRGAANTLRQLRTTNAQTFELYNTTDSDTAPVNYERGFMRWATNILEIGTEKGGTGVIRNLSILGGNIGIGTVTQTSKLHIHGTNDAIAITDSGNVNGWAGFRTASSAGPIFGFNSAHDFRFSSYSSNTPFSGYIGDLLTITGGGDVGIGTSPSAKLHVQGSSTIGVGAIVENTSADGYGVISVKGDVAGVNLQFVGSTDASLSGFEGWGRLTVDGAASGLAIICVGADPLTFSTNNSERLRVTSGGDFGVGVVVPTAKLHVDQSSATGAIPVLKLDQADIDDSFIDFIGTSAADGTRSISSDTTEDSTKFGAIQVEINGVTKWIRIYDNES